MSTALYQKPYLTVPEQVELLRSRGMHIGNAARAEACLHRIGYYRLSGYAYPFRHRELFRQTDGTQTERIFENFRPNTDFATVMELYVFDKRLRLLFLDAIERVEVALRVEIAIYMGKLGALSYRESGLFNRYFTTATPPMDQTPHQRWLSKLDDAFSRSREEFALHYTRKYLLPPPLWMSIEVWDFGCLATVLSGMKDGDVNHIAGIFKLPQRRYLTSWSQSINFVRNICAHHGRLWNRPLVQQPAPPVTGDVPMLDHLAADTFAQRRLYAVAAALQHLMSIVHPASTWGARLKQHLATLPMSPHLSIRHMGFPEQWNSLELWKTA